MEAQSSPALRRLPACVIAAAFAFATSLSAQQHHVGATAVRRAPAGVVLARLVAPQDLVTGARQPGWVTVTVDGWIAATSVAPEKRDGFALAVTARDGENLRAAPNGRVVARLQYGALLERVEERGGWVHVRRSGWVSAGAVSAPAPAAYHAMAVQKPDSAPAARSATPAATVAADLVEPARSAGIFATPEGAQTGTLQHGATARIVARAGDWVRVQTDGWVRASDLQPAAGASLGGVSAAEVRADPDRYVGQLLDWRLQVVAVQTADELRPEISPGQPYLLTRGPLPEAGFVYVAIPRDQAARFRAMGPLSELTLRVRIRAARSKYLATPVAELVAVVDSSATHR